ncbi:hypothetical protein HanRHA438_Chr11g0517801 [Helianthus annuus]|nr:hypothetical protein HanIR_Chr11g0543791 [Helianthus annuus]KAJ0871905.1 hypothetical protein HanRHA438_Chr11g0517801 [Helianthus annuus]
MVGFCTIVIRSATLTEQIRMTKKRCSADSRTSPHKGHKRELTLMFRRASAHLVANLSKPALHAKILTLLGIQLFHHAIFTGAPNLCCNISLLRL